MSGFDPMAPRRLVAALAVLLLSVGMTASGSAQYFGRNKVNYQKFDFQVLETPHFHVYYYLRERDAAVLAAQMAERWYLRYSMLLDHELTGKQPLILYASHAEFAQTTVLPGEIGEGTGGVTEALKRRIVLPMEGSQAETDHVIGHELLHAFQYDVGGVAPTHALHGAPAITGMPLWVMEGLAEYFSLGPRSALTAMWLRDGLAHNRLPSVHDLEDDSEYFPYRWGQALWGYVAGHWGEKAAWAVLKNGLSQRDPAGAIDSILGISADSLSILWHAEIAATYGPLERVTTGAGDVGTLLTGKERGAMDLGPALSPDGRRLLYLSSRDPYSIDLYLADAQTGKVIRRLTQSALDSHFQSLEFVNSAGAWSADNERIAFAVVGKGAPALVIMRATTGTRIRTERLSQFSEIANPTWSPDGQHVAFVANEGGFLDLWIMDVGTGALHRLTNDAYAEMQPSWSPDGRWIAITTDRFGRGYSLALVNAATGAISPVTGFPGSRNINPKWSPDGASLYFVADPDGISNLYRVRLAGGAPVALTRLFTGVSGLTETSPAFDLAQGTGRIVFTAFENNGHRLYRLDTPAVATVAAGVAAGVAPGWDAAVLPPSARRDARLTAMLEGGEPGLPSPRGFQHREYKSTLSLDYVAPPSLGFSIGGYGTFIGGGTALHFSDMLGFQEVATQLQLQIDGSKLLNGIGAEVTWINRRHRANYGFDIGQVPELSQAFGEDLVDVNGDGNPELLEQTLRFWTISRQAMGLFQYPFSVSDRVEFSAGFQRIDFDAQSEFQIFSLITGDQLSRRTVDAPPCGDSLSIQTGFCRPAGLSEFQGSVAYVHDQSISGYTGPVQGSRARFEVAPSVGTLNFVSVLGDWREYVRLARPVTLALRVMHYGRYLNDAEDQRLNRLFLGYSTFIRGYDNNSFSLDRCPDSQPVDQCSEVQVFDRLFGSKLAVANAEARLSLFGPVGVIGHRFLPMDLVGFSDAGVAWSRNNPSTPGVDERPTFLGGDRKPLTSAGAGLRVNLLGFALAELDWVKPFQRPLRGGYFTFSFNSGF